MDRLVTFTATANAVADTPPLGRISVIVRVQAEVFISYTVMYVFAQARVYFDNNGGRFVHSSAPFVQNYSYSIFRGVRT